MKEKDETGGCKMSMDVMAWMRVRPKSNDEKSKEGFKAFVDLFRHNTMTVQYQVGGTLLLYLESVSRISKTASLDEIYELDLMGNGNGRAFSSAQEVLEVILDHKDALIQSMGYEKKTKEQLRKNFEIIEKSDLQLGFLHTVIRVEDCELMIGFEEFVWCSHDNCKIPAEYNYKVLATGEIQGEDDFPVDRPLTNEDTPYCERHFLERVYA